MTISWAGESNEQLRAQFTIRDGQPVVQELAARDSKGTWIVLGKELSPEFQVTTGRRRISGVQRNLLKVQGIDTPEQENIRKWNTFWDAPLVMPGHHDSTDLPRLPEEIKRAAVAYKSDNCTVTTTGGRVSVITIKRRHFLNERHQYHPRDQLAGFQRGAIGIELVCHPTVLARGGITGAGDTVARQDFRSRKNGIPCLGR